MLHEKTSEELAELAKSLSKKSEELSAYRKAVALEIERRSVVLAAAEAKKKAEALADVAGAKSEVAAPEWLK